MIINKVFDFTMTLFQKFGLVTASLALALAGCQSAPQESAETEDVSEESASTGEQVVNVYSARHYNTDSQLYEGFTEQTGIEVNIIEGKDSELIERIKSEGTSSPADVFITVDAGRLWRAEDEGLFQPTSSEILTNNIPEKLRHPDGLWFGLSQRARIFVYDPEKVTEQEMSTYENLASPEWEGRVCTRSSSNIYSQSLLAWLIEKDGPEQTETWAEGLVNNFAREPEGGDIPQIQGVADGSCELAVVNHYYLARLMKSDDATDRAVAERVAAFFPSETHMNISGAGVLANAPNSQNAVKLVEYLTGAEAQEFFALQNNEYPAVEGIGLDPVLEGFGEFTASPINVVAYGENAAEALEIADRVGWK